MVCVVVFIGGLRGGEITLQNPGFEQDTNLDNQPDDWLRAGRPNYDLDSQNAHSGFRSAKVNDPYHYSQSFDVTGGSHYTLSYWGKGESGYDFGAIDGIFTSDDSFRAFSRSRTFLAPVDYKEFLASFRAPLPAHTFFYLPRSSWVNSWVWVDDCRAYDEYIHNGNFETHTGGLPQGWSITGDPFLDCSGMFSHSPRCALLVDNNDWAFQPIAVADRAKTYVLIYWAHADTPHDTSFLMDWFDRDAHFMSRTVFEFSVTTEYQAYAFEFVPPPGAVIGGLVLRPEQGHAVWVDDVALYWHTAEPAVFSPNDDQLQDTTRIVYSIDQPSTVSVKVMDISESVIRVLEENAQKGRTVSGLEWDGNDDYGLRVSDGEYRYRIDVQNPFTPFLALEGVVTVDTDNFYSEPVHQFTDFFPRGIWVYAGGPFEDWNYDLLYEDIREHNFNAALLNWIPESRYHDALAAGETYGIKTILHAITLNEMIEEYLPYRSLSEEMVRTEVQRLKDLNSAFTSLIGYYVIDEPAERYRENLFMVNTIMNEISPGEPGYSAIENQPELLEAFEQVRPAVLLHYFYPLPIRERARPEDFDQFIQNIDEVTALAELRDVPMWMILMGYAPTRLNGLPTPAELRCQAYLAIAHGVNGIFYFMYQSSNGVIGLIDFEGNPTDRYEALGELMGEIAALEPLLVQRRGITNIASCSNYACDVQTFIDSVGTYYIIAVNKDCQSMSFPTITVDLANVQGIYEVRDNHPVAFMTTNSETVIELDMFPGDGRILRLEQ